MLMRHGRSTLFHLVLILFAGDSANADCQPGDTLTLLHFNDFHGQLESVSTPEMPAGGIARLATVVRQVRAEQPEHPVMLLFAGDVLQGTITSSLFLGLPDIALFNRLGVDAAVMGNHELDDGQEVFRRLAEQAKFPFLSANVQSHPVPLPVQSTLVMTTSDGSEIAVLGLTTPELTTAIHPRHAIGLSVEDPVSVARRRLPELQKHADLVIVLSHLGLADDQRLAQAVPGIDLIVGGHSHHALEQPVMAGDVAIVQAGERGQWLGRMDLDCRNGHLEPTAYRLLPMDASVPEDPDIAAEVAHILAEAEAGLMDEIGVAAVELSARREEIRRTEAVFGNLVADLARQLTQSDVAFFNAGSFRATIPRGTVTLRQVSQAFPFHNVLVVGQLSGAAIIAALQRSAALDPDENPGGFLQVSGIRYSIADRRLSSASLTTGSIDPQHLYQVVMPDFLAAGGDGYVEFAGMTDQVLTGRLVSDMLIDALRHEQTLAPRLDGRIERRHGS